jgi:hypothetical protein
VRILRRPRLAFTDVPPDAKALLVTVSFGKHVGDFDDSSYEETIAEKLFFFTSSGIQRFMNIVTECLGNTGGHTMDDLSFVGSRVDWVAAYFLFVVPFDDIGMQELDRVTLRNMSWANIDMRLAVDCWLSSDQDAVLNIRGRERCFECGKDATQRCSACGVTFYCGVECQRKDWKTHKLICPFIRNNN